MQKWCMVAHTGFEPVISSLRGRCPKPLDECATPKKDIDCSQKFTTELLEKFITSRPEGASKRTLEYNFQEGCIKASP